MVEKEVNGKIVNINDKKLLWGLALVFVIGTLVSGNFTGYAGRVSVTKKLAYNEFSLYEGGVIEYPLKSDNWIRLKTIGYDSTIVVQVVNNRDVDERYIKPGNSIYINGITITNIHADHSTKLATLRVE